MSSRPPDLSAALAEAVASVRAATGDPTGTVVLLVPGDANGVLARQTLALAGPVIRVEAWTPDRLVHHLGELALAGRRPEPAGWRRATVGVSLRQLGAVGALGVHGPTLALPGWRDVVAEALTHLEDAGVDPVALRSAPAPDPGLAERAQLLAALLEALEARRREEGLYSGPELAAAAVASPSGAPIERAIGAVILGDTRLPRATHAAVRAFLAPRPVVRVELAPQGALASEPTGLAAAAPHAVVLQVAAPPGALGEVLGRLFRPSGTPVDPQDGLALQVAPDEVREVREVARTVQDAILSGTPLDRIAVALPSGEAAAGLRAELERAGIPATWLTGPPLGAEPTPRFVRLVADLASGDDSVRRWYELLRQPGLRLRARLGPAGTAGRGRWRRILQRCGAVAGTDAVVGAVTAWAAQRDPSQPGAAEDQAAAASLLAAIGAIRAELGVLRERAPLGAHAARLAAFLERWWARTRDREQVLQLLHGWAASTAGYPFSLAEAADELADAFAGTPALEGTLSDAAIRVLSPMALLGGAFDLVVVPGLAHGRFPTEPRDGALLTDALALHLNTALGVELPTSERVRAEDRRRFAAALGSCRRRAVLSWPASDLVDGKPRLPGELALEVVSALLGRRAGFADAAAVAAKVGSRARPHVADPERALGPLEFLLALAAADRVAAVGWLAADPRTRRQLALHRSPWRLRRDGVRDAWSGAVPPTTLRGRGLDGAPLTVKELSELLRDPASFLFRRMWQAWPADPLPDGLDLVDPGAIRDRLVDAVRLAMEVEGPLEPAVFARWAASVDAATAHVPGVDPADRALADALAELRWRAARAHVAAHRGPALDVPPTALGDGLPWVVAGRLGQRTDDAVVELATRARDPDVGSRPGPLIAALAAERAGHAVAAAGSVDLERARVVPLEGARAALAARLAGAAERAERGTWPWGPRDTFRLADEQAEELG